MAKFGQITKNRHPSGDTEITIRDIGEVGMLKRLGESEVEYKVVQIVEECVGKEFCEDPVVELEFSEIVQYDEIDQERILEYAYFFSLEKPDGDIIIDRGVITVTVHVIPDGRKGMGVIKEIVVWWDESAMRKESE